MSFFRRLFGAKSNANTEEQNDRDASLEASTATAVEPQTTQVTEQVIEEENPDKVDEVTTEPLSETPLAQAVDEATTIESSENGETTKPVQPDAEMAFTPAAKLAPEETLPHPAEGVTRPLEGDPFDIYQPATGHLTFAHSSDQGMVRNNNQDATYRFFASNHSVDNVPDFGLFIVADGMGGHNHGELASATTVQFIATAVIKSLYLPLLNKSNEDDEEPFTISDILNHAVKEANKQVIRTVPDGGTTLTAVLVLGDVAHFAHVGDSRAYMIRDEKIEQLTRDHSLAQRLIELNQLSADERGDYQHRNVLYRAIGHSEDLEVDTLIRRLPGSAYILLCSDGLWGEVTEEDMVKTITEAKSLQEACDNLVAMANRQGGHDNITALLLKTPIK
ncbi:protein phosphatase 2C domain-containing protein [Phototrophicus methaneseepsis]|uniref:Protein phosphatase 2C domain-containing protein n=1 Tax=Phototrophicus methaneseepsis TaxID=2710758 RepID=A0A7S8ID50_9CHLR|nr:protein phosphatase 2C domain-containing protein [Phototrophicus methaneseepsis]QPC81181.1 protein phosphatase 2C domain-containing protein [Phototrophicus methaneseepsis]